MKGYWEEINSFGQNMVLVTSRFVGEIPVWAIYLQAGLDDPCRVPFNSEYAVSLYER